MQAFEVQRNGQRLVVAGAEGVELLSLTVSVSVDDVHHATLDMRGIRDLGNDRHAHLAWIQELPLNLGDEIRVTLVEVEDATPPVEEIASDSEEQIAAQAAYEAQLASAPPELRELERKQPDATLEVVVGDAPVVATFEGGRELMTMRASWMRRRPERCRLSLRTVSVKEALSRQGGMDWLTASAAIGEAVIVRVGVSQA